MTSCVFEFRCSLPRLRRSISQLRLIADFIGLTPSDDVIKGVVAMSTKEFMARPEHASKFDESVTYKRLVEVGRAADTTSFRVRKCYALCCLLHVSA